MVVMQPNVLVRSTIRAQEMYLQDTHGTRQCTCKIHKAPGNVLTSKMHKERSCIVILLLAKCKVGTPLN